MNSLDKLISLIIPVYNVEKYITQCLSSVFTAIDHQFLSQLEVILVNDKTPDVSMTKAKPFIDKYPDVIKVINHDENLGLGGARNSGIKTAKGKFVCFLDSDDFFYKKAINTLFEITEQLDDDTIGVFGFEAIKDNKKLWGFSFINAEYTSAEALSELINDNINPSVWNKIYPRQLLKGVEFMPHTYYEDIGFVPLMLFKAKTVKIFDKTLLAYRQDGESITRKTTGSTHVLDLSKMLKSLSGQLDKNVLMSLFFNRWAFHLIKWELNSDLLKLALSEILNYLKSNSIKLTDTDYAVKLMIRINQLRIVYSSSEIDTLSTELEDVLQKSDESHEFLMKMANCEIEDLKSALIEQKKENQWYKKTYETLPWWWKKIGGVIRRML